MEALWAARGCEAGELVGRRQIPRTPSPGSGPAPGPGRPHPLSSLPKPSLLQVCQRVCLHLPSMFGQHQVTRSRASRPERPEESLYNGQFSAAGLGCTCSKSKFSYATLECTTSSLASPYARLECTSKSKYIFKYARGC